MVTRIAKARYLRVAGFAVGAVVIAGVAVVATASAAGLSFAPKSNSPQSTDAQAAAVEASAQSTVCSDFMKNFANEIHKSQAEINAAFQKAIADTLADEVKNKRITQAQADAIKKKLANQTPCTLPSNFGHAGGGGGAPAIKAFMDQYLAAAASALGVTEAQLKSDLAAGQSLSQVASAQHVSEADFRTRLIANLTPALDAAVTKKTISAAQEQEILNHLKTGELPLWNLPAHKPKPTPAVPPAA